MGKNILLLVGVVVVAVGGVVVLRPSTPVPVEVYETPTTPSIPIEVYETPSVPIAENSRLNLNESVTIDGVTITPLVINEDSRCIAGWQCIWAGRVVVQTRLVMGSTNKIENIELDKPVTFVNKTVTLVSAVAPYQTAGAELDKSKYNYYFEYTVKNTATAKCYVGGCSGQICSDKEGLVSTCEYAEAYACFKTAKCERQTNGQCGWTETSTLRMCLDTAR